jgi:hypothetical protein
MSRLLERGATSAYWDSDGRHTHVLVVAAGSGSVEAVRLLLDRAFPARDEGAIPKTT